MEKYDETHRTLTGCLEEVETLMAIISNRLLKIDIPVMELSIEYWPTFMRDQTSYKVWNGVEHLVPTFGKPAVPGRLTAKELLGVVRRRKILMRKFDGI